jgi:hypothetical protein
VTYPAIFEAWNFLAGRYRKMAEAYYMIRWLLTPGSVILISDNLDEAVLYDHSQNTENST